MTMRLLLVAPLVPGLLPATSWGPANRVTLLRSGVVGLVAGFTVDPQSGWWTVALALLAFALDGLDGQVARRWKAGSALGARYDGEIDAIFILVLSALSWQLGRAGAWVLLGGLLRYAFLGAGLLLPWMRRPVPPSYRAKIICVVHVSCLIASLLPPVPPVLAALLAGGGLLALTGSFAVDTAWLWRRRAGDELAPARQEAR